MHRRLLVPLACLLALLAVPAAAAGKLVVGISENSSRLFSDPTFKKLRARHVRVVVSYDVVSRNDDELARVNDYLSRARAAGIEPLVTFEHSRGDASACNRRKNFNKRVCRLPTPRQYERNVKLFLARFPFVRLIAPWNEANHFTQPTSRSPKAAAQFTNIVHKDCRRCRLVVADMLDQADNPSARHPTFRKTARYIKKFRRALKVKRTICGVHNYSDVNRFRQTGTKAVIKALGCKQIWLTETGGLFKFGSFWSKKTRKGCRTASACQLKATKYMFSTARRNKRIKRLYVYTWFGAVTKRFDAGLVAHGRPRAAEREVAKRIR